MVRGLNVFKEYFAEYTNQYVIIGGTACDIILGGAGFRPRATKDIDIILVVEALNADFVKQFWQFIKDGKYERNEKSFDDKKYYRFVKPDDDNFPFQIELFARNPDLIDLGEDAHLTPIPVDDDLSSLSAILLDDDYYQYMLAQSELEDGLRRANTEALICLKAKAYFEIADRITKGGKEDAKHLNKHKGDIFRLAATLVDTDVFVLPTRIRTNMQAFMDEISSQLPDKDIFEKLGMGKIDSEVVYSQMLKNFQLKGK